MKIIKVASKKAEQLTGEQNQIEFSCSSKGPQKIKVEAGDYFSPTFKCDDSVAKANALRAFLDDLGTSLDVFCIGSCPGKKDRCEPYSLGSNIRDDMELKLIENDNGTCVYWAEVTGDGKTILRVECECITPKVRISRE